MNSDPVEKERLLKEAMPVKYIGHIGVGASLTLQASERAMLVWKDSWDRWDRWDR